LLDVVQVVARAIRLRKSFTKLGTRRVIFRFVVVAIEGGERWLEISGAVEFWHECTWRGNAIMEI